MLTSRQKNQRAFTIIELMVTLAILGILLGIVVPSMQQLLTGSRLDDALRDTTLVFTKAKKLAQFEGIPIRVKIAVGGGALEIRDTTANANLIQSIPLPEVTVSTNPVNTDFTFDTDGVLEDSKLNTTLILTSSQDNTRTKILTVATAFGQLNETDPAPPAPVN